MKDLERRLEEISNLAEIALEYVQHEEWEEAAATLDSLLEEASRILPQIEEMYS